MYIYMQIYIFMLDEVWKIIRCIDWMNDLCKGWIGEVTQQLVLCPTLAHWLGFVGDWKDRTG